MVAGPAKRNAGYGKDLMIGALKSSLNRWHRLSSLWPGSGLAGHSLERLCHQTV
jgi:hypothetical protein